MKVTRDSLGEERRQSGILTVPVRLLVKTRSLSLQFRRSHVRQVLDDDFFLEKLCRFFSNQRINNFLEHVFLCLFSRFIGRILRIMKMEITNTVSVSVNDVGTQDSSSSGSST